MSLQENQSAVDQEIRKVIADNDKLSQQVEVLMKQKLQNAVHAQNTEPEYQEIEEMRKQILMITKVMFVLFLRF